MVAVRRLDGDGVVQRRISSTARSMETRPARSRSSCSGHSTKASSAPAIALRVVSAPAEKSKEKKAESSSSLSRGGCSSGSSAWTTAESMSWAGCARFSSMSAVPYPYIRSTADCRRGLMDKKSDSSGMSKMCSTASKRR